MFRRRAFRRPLPGGPIRRRYMLAMQEANRLLAEGRFAQAAPRFAELAHAAQAHNRPRRAAHLHFQAARAWFEAGNPAQGMQHARQALHLADQTGDRVALQRIAARALPRLRELGYTQEADALQALLPAEDSAPQSGAEIRALTCPQCGASLQAEMRLDARTAECAYCGSLISLG
ncbi:MAG: hypothetical protein D6755_10835 [Anaerolineae bacterium]|nr:MAG: hypothetical protein D6755_10835 [Anaerolineae bacterium]